MKPASPFESRVHQAVEELSSLIFQEARARAIAQISSGGSEGSKRAAPSSRKVHTNGNGNGHTRVPKADPAQRAESEQIVLAFVQANPGLRTEQIKAGVNLDPDLVKKCIAALRADGQLKSKGQKRATSYTAKA